MHIPRFVTVYVQFSGIRLVKNALGPLQRLITAVRWVSCWYTTSPTKGLLTVSLNSVAPNLRSLHFLILDIRTWHSNIEQHASEGVNKILIGNKSDWTDKRAVTEEHGRELANELGIKFMETSAKVNEGVEEAFFTLARFVLGPLMLFSRLTDLVLLIGTSRPVSSTHKQRTQRQVDKHPTP